MSDTAKRDAVLEEFAHDAGVHRVWGVAGMADEILRLRAENAALRAAVERVRALHTPISYPEGDFPNDKWCTHCEMIHGSVYWGDNDPTRWPCPTLRALEETP